MIELVDAIPKLETVYRDVVQKMIDKESLTLKEWNARFKTYRDEYGYSIIHLFEAHLQGIEGFITINPIMLENRTEFSERFGVEVKTPEELMKEEEK